MPDYDLDTTAEDIAEFNVWSSHERQFMCIFVVRWRNQALDKHTAQLLNGWATWQAFLKAKARATRERERVAALEAAIELLDEADPGEREPAELKLLAQFVANTKMFGKDCALTEPQLLAVAQDLVLTNWNRGEMFCMMGESQDAHSVLMSGAMAAFEFDAASDKRKLLRERAALKRQAAERMRALEALPAPALAAALGNTPASAESNNAGGRHGSMTRRNSTELVDAAILKKSDRGADTNWLETGDLGRSAGAFSTAAGPANLGSFRPNAFGEAFRGVSLVAAAPSRVLSIGRKVYDDCIRAQHEATRDFDDKVAFFSRLTLMRRWGARAVKDLAKAARVHRSGKGEELATQGAPIEKVSFIASGDVKIGVRLEAGPKRTVEITQVGAETLIGDIDVVLKKKSHITTATCQGPVLTYDVPTALFAKLVVGAPKHTGTYIMLMDSIRARKMWHQKRVDQEMRVRRDFELPPTGGGGGGGGGVPNVNHSLVTAVRKRSISYDTRELLGRRVPDSEALFRSPVVGPGSRRSLQGADDFDWGGSARRRPLHDTPPTHLPAVNQTRRMRSITIDSPPNAHRSLV